MLIDLTPKERKHILEALESDFKEIQNDLMNTSGLSEEEMETAEKELKQYKQIHNKIKEKLSKYIR